MVPEILTLRLLFLCGWYHEIIKLVITASGPFQEKDSKYELTKLHVHVNINIYIYMGKNI